MVPELRKKYNSEFTAGRYDAFVRELSSSMNYPVDFRVSETPLFLSSALATSLIEACNEILQTIRKSDYLRQSGLAIPPHLNVPNETPHPEFLQIDFAICKGANGEYLPQLIELQGFPSLYCYQILLDDVWRKHFNIPDRLTPYFNGLNRFSYIEMLKGVIVGEEDPEQVVLLEIDPKRQKTRIDFACTASFLGVGTASLSDLTVRGKKIFVKNNGKEVPVRRIYNRVIFDELARYGHKFEFDFHREYDVSWAGHPNWFFKLSKFTLPFLKNKYCPSCQFLSEMDQYPRDLENCVLKPLFSFAGTGVQIEVTRQLLDSIKKKDDYILQRKIEYAPSIETPDGYSKAEIRMMFLWDEEPMLVNNLVRLSKGAMMGVDYNKNKTWVGSSLAYHA